VRRFVEDYHERSEEEHVFPRLERAGKLVELVRVLKRQHDAGRVLTVAIQELATSQGLGDDAKRKELGDALRQFTRMYRPHSAREDSVAFLEFRALLSGRELDALGDVFEREEERRLGAHGYERMVERVAGLERALGIFELDRFTPT
jgi:hemerythrin-like domain-containing protein